MVTAARHWKAEISDLRGRAELVTSSDVAARQCAKTLAGVMRTVATKYSLEAMQRACADLARDDQAWRSGLGEVPPGEPVKHIATFVRGMVMVFGATAVRAALAFWASEDDPAVWLNVAG